MVAIIDITSDRLKTKGRAELEKKLAEECFPGKRVENDVLPSYIYIYKDKKIVADKSIGTIKMTIYDEDFLSQAIDFARRYEKQFGLKEHHAPFIIETDYSKNR